MMQEVKWAEATVAQEMPNASFNFAGTNSDMTKVFFHVACKLSQTNEIEIDRLEVKTRFSCDQGNGVKGDFAYVQDFWVFTDNARQG